MAEELKQSANAIFYLARKQVLKDARKDVDGINLEDVYKQADIDYSPTPAKTDKSEVNPYKGTNLRTEQGAVNLDESDWQSKNKDAATFSKVQTAISLFFDRNPVPVMTAGSKKFQATTEFAKVVITDSQEKEKYKEKLKLFAFNGIKYGTGHARTMIRETKREFEDLVSINPVTGEKKYEKKTVISKNVHFKPINNWNVWVDPGAKPYQPETKNDWMYRDAYSDDRLMAEFGTGKFKSVVEEILETEAVPVAKTSQNNGEDSLNLKERQVYFYENFAKDLVIAECDGKVILEGKLPTHKRLSHNTFLWNLRSDSTIHGIGIPEIMRQDKRLLDKVRNMSVDQLVLSIYKMFFYDGTLDTEDTDLRVRPGKGQRVLDPSKLKWLEVPGPGKEGLNREEALRRDMDASTGINEALGGGSSGGEEKKALALLQEKEAGLAKVKVGLDNLLFAMSLEAENRWDLLQELNMMPQEVKKILDPKEAQEFLDEIEGNKELFFHDTEEGALYAFKFNEVRAKIEEDENGTFVKSKEENFFFVTPARIRWNGDIIFTGESILNSNSELKKQMMLEMYNLVIPLLSMPQEIVKKPVFGILEEFNVDPDTIVPDHWIGKGQPPAPVGPDGQPVPQAPPQGQELPAPAVDQLQPLPQVIPQEEINGEGLQNPVDGLLANQRLQ